MRRIIPLLIAVLLVASCSTHVEYEQPAIVSQPDAININTATASELESLPHIGRKTAEAIVKFRNENGPFRRVEHLLLIRGMGERRFSQLRPLLRTE
jgi:competence protein ComEA